MRSAMKMSLRNSSLLLLCIFSVASHAQLDSDFDGVDDAVDNCIAVANINQRDSNADGYGNVCDADYDNNCVVNLIDLQAFKTAFLSTSQDTNWNADVDSDGDGRVNFFDIQLLVNSFLSEPGPAGSFACGAPVLPNEPLDYVSYAETNLPDHFTVPSRPGDVANLDNIPADNQISNAGATLGRVLFYDKKLSINDTISCSSCHHQANGFDEPDAVSTGFQGGTTDRHSMALANVRYYGSSLFGGVRTKMFWDERADTLEDQVLMPIEDPVEMGNDLELLTGELSGVDYYPALFTNAFGSPEINAERISKALAQFVRSMVTYQSKYDLALSTAIDNIEPNLAVFTAQEREGAFLFGMPGLLNAGPFKCDLCHANVTVNSATTFNNGLDAITIDEGTAGVTPGPVEFKAPSLRNVAVRGRFMHDGRFTDLRDVIEFYNTDIQPHVDLNPLLKAEDQTPIQMNMTEEQIDAMVAFLGTMTDPVFLISPLFTDPFKNQPL